MKTTSTEEDFDISKEKALLKIAKKHAKITSLLYGLSCHFKCQDPFARVLVFYYPEELKKRIRKALYNRKELNIPDEIRDS